MDEKKREVAEKIVQALNRKGAELGNASIHIIEPIIDLMIQEAEKKAVGEIKDKIMKLIDRYLGISVGIHFKRQLIKMFNNITKE